MVWLCVKKGSFAESMIIDKLGRVVESCGKVERVLLSLIKSIV